MEYHINLNGKNIGVLTLEQIKESKIDPAAIVWYDGLGDWKPVAEVEELKDYIKSTPPPIPKSARRKLIHTPGYLVLGSILLTISVLLNSNGVIEDSMDNHPVITSALLITGRIIACSFVVGTMKLYKRQPLWWGVLAFFLPSLAFITTAFVKPVGKSGVTSDS